MWPRRGILLLAALATLSLAGRSILSYAHLAAVPHVVCAEHGELHHAEGAHHSRHTAKRASGLALRASALAAGHQHDHCPLCPTTRERFKGAAETIAKAAALAPARVASDNAHLLPCGLTFRTAPKQSPPA